MKSSKISILTSIYLKYLTSRLDLTHAVETLFGGATIHNKDTERSKLIHYYHRTSPLPWRMTMKHIYNHESESRS